LLSEIGVFFCLSSSIVFSLTLIEKKEREESNLQVSYHEIEGGNPSLNEYTETDLFRNESL
jgi:hypothetical protein